jgi:hypothetical protein
VARGLLKDFAAGFDPSGVKTIAYGQQDAIKGKKKSSAGIAAAAGGTLGGLTIVPALVGGLTQLKRGGLVRSFVQGMKQPFKLLYHGNSASKGLKKSLKSSYLSKKTAKSLRILGKEKTANRKVRKALTDIRHGKINLKNKGNRGALKAVQKQIENETSQTTKAFLVSGALAGTSAGMQYDKGYNLEKAHLTKKAEDETSKRLKSLAVDSLVGFGLIKAPEAAGSFLAHPQFNRPHGVEQRAGKAQYNKLKKIMKYTGTRIQDSGLGAHYRTDTHAVFAPKKGPVEVLAHEIGHGSGLRNSAKYRKVHEALRAANHISVAGLVPGALAWATDDPLLQNTALGASMVPALGTISEEVRASVRGYKALKKLNIGKAGLKRARKHLALAGGTYAAYLSPHLLNTYLIKKYKKKKPLTKKEPKVNP